MSHGSGVNAEIYFNQVPLIEGIWDLAVGQVIPGGTSNNHSWISPHVTYDKVRYQCSIAM
jgi:selenophosphate synthase